ncbi:hypothetical protein [Actinospongicola halichondriae]|uniref:hypothetical protein n=1 Tax=Actinospongicola halichondriae TaxID=3236844 RepID=UPI003D3D7C0B
MRPLPSFIVIGPMKGGTTSVFNWLASHPGVNEPDMKEPDFFSTNWQRGEDWYRALFPDGRKHLITGEASPSYSDPQYATAAAERMRSTLPEVRLVFIARTLEDRIRSHYLHEVRRGRERRTFADAVGDPAGPYQRLSRYGDGLAPYLDAFGPEQVLIASFDELVHTGDAWPSLLRHLELDEYPWPATRLNAASDGLHLSRTGAALWNRGVLQRASVVPKPVRRALRRVVFRDPEAELVRSANDAVPPPVRSALDAAADAFARVAPNGPGLFAEVGRTTSNADE